MASEARLKGQVAELEVVAHLLGQKNKSLVSEKLVREDVWSLLKARVESLMQTNEVLMIQNKSLERNLADRDRELEALKADHDWLL